MSIKKDIELLLDSCRMYEQEFPEIDDTVMVKVTSIDDNGAHVMLMEYNLPGFLSVTHYSRKWMRSIKKVIGAGKEYALHVLNLNKKSKIVDLSKKMITPKEEKECRNNYKKCRKVHSILAHTAFLNGISLEELYQHIGWKLYKDYKDPCEAFQLICNDEPILEKYYDMDNKIVCDLKDLIRRQYHVKPQKFAKSFQIMSLDRRGVNVIKECLDVGENALREISPKHLKGYKIISNGAPIYQLDITAKNQVEADKLFKIVLSAITEKTKEYNKTFVK